ncbi:hypothetical protein BHE74_00049987 [Ensete ventricosum]|nr:hypothetical protein BHE74_00049987 [Ensete ventricosum]
MSKRLVGDGGGSNGNKRRRRQGGATVAKEGDSVTGSGYDSKQVRQQLKRRQRWCSFLLEILTTRRGIGVCKVRQGRGSRGGGSDWEITVNGVLAIVAATTEDSVGLRQREVVAAGQRRWVAAAEGGGISKAEVL